MVLVVTEKSTVRAQSDFIIYADNLSIFFMDLAKLILVLFGLVLFGVDVEV